jgi:hypothetical protein
MPDPGKLFQRITVETIPLGIESDRPHRKSADSLFGHKVKLGTKCLDVQIRTGHTLDNSEGMEMTWPKYSKSDTRTGRITEEAQLSSQRYCESTWLKGRKRIALFQSIQRIFNSHKNYFDELQ